MSSIQELIKTDQQRRSVLIAVHSLSLPDCYVAAGFVRNLVWDYLHDYDMTPLNDVDVIFFDKEDKFSAESIESQLYQQLPDVKWQVKNQALMHHRNGDRAYLNSTDAMSYWPEKETAIGVRLVKGGALDISAPFGTDSLFSGCISHNPKRSMTVFKQRVRLKKWLEKWPQLKVII